MTGGGNNEMFTNRSTIGDDYVESGSITEQVSKIKMKALPIETSLEMIEDGANNPGHVEDIDQWVASLKRILDDVPSYMCSRGHPGRVSRIPNNLREVDIKGYEPYLLSIGPYHHGKPKVKRMEMSKKLALKYVLEYKPEVTLKDCLKEIVSMEQTARSFYSDVGMDSECFVQMLLLDSVYILTTFFRLERSPERINETNARISNRMDAEDVNVRERRKNEAKEEDVDENLKMVAKDVELNIGESWYWLMFAHDLFLIENQIPFFLLQKIHSLVYGGSGTEFIDIMKDQIANLLKYYTRPDPKTVVVQAEDVHHILHLGHLFFHPIIEQEYAVFHSWESRQMFRLGSAVQLYEAGVQFESRSCTSNYSLLDITFDRSGKMTMPCLLVDDNTESLLRNLIALEQMEYPSLGLDMSAYIVLLLHLITIPKDAELLRRKGIIQHHLASDKEIMCLINRLSAGLAFDYVEDMYSLKHVFHELKRYSERRVPRWRAWLEHRHFSNPWTAISLLVAFIILLLTFVQTYYTVYSYYYPYFNEQL